MDDDDDDDEDEDEDEDDDEDDDESLDDELFEDNSEPLHSCFREAQDQIYTLMEQDNFPRFKRSLLFTKLLNDLDVYRQNSIRHIRLDRMGDNEEMLKHKEDERALDRSYGTTLAALSMPGSSKGNALGNTSPMPTSSHVRHAL